MSELGLVAIVFGILLFVVVLAHIARVLAWRGRFPRWKGHGREPSSAIPELDEVILRGDHFRNQVAHLSEAFNTIHSVSEELVRAAEEWQGSYSMFEAKVSRLYAEERDLSNKVDSLRNTPLPALEHFNEIIEREGRKSEFRDYALFLMGVIASLALTLLLKGLGL